MNNYYATYQNIGQTDIAVFDSEEKRDEWVNFQDPFSKSLGSNPDNATFQRVALNTKEAECLIRKYKNVLPRKDDFDPNLAWYMFSCLAAC